MLRASAVIGLSLLILPFMPARGEEGPEAGRQDVTVNLRMRGRASGGAAAALSVRAVAIWYGKGKVDPVEIALTGKNPGHMELRPGRWVLAAEAAGYWGSEFQLELGEKAAAVTLDLWPAGVLEGGFLLADGLRPPADLLLFLRAAPGESAAAAPPPSRVVCAVRQESWTCPVPAGVLDLRLQAPGFIPRYLWGVRVTAGQTVRPGRMDLHQGSAVQGWVVTVDGASLGDNAWVTLRPRVGAAVPDAKEKQRLESLIFKAQVNSRGFFQMEGVPPGAYLLEARHESYAPAVVSVRVIPGEVTEIANPPLVLDHPKVVEVFVDPPLGPSDRPWSVKLQRFDRDTSVMIPFAQERVATDGVWRKSGVPPGSYLLHIGPSPAETWWMGEVAVEENPAPVQVSMRLVRVKGTVQLGDKPLAAKIDFGGKFGAVRIEAAADEKGKFETLLPKAGDWVVYVTAEDPAVEREIPKVRVEPKPGTEEAIVDLDLPDTLLRGSVITEAGGDPVAGALVTAMSAGAVRESAVQVRADRDGRFELRGILPGTTLVEAAGGEDLVAEAVAVDVRPEKESQPIVLRAGPRLRVTGTVVSATGPVPGARVKAVPVGVPTIATRIMAADAAGRFTLLLPPATREMLVTVNAPGFALRTLRLPVPETRELAIGLEQSAGTLVLETDGPADYADPNAPMIYVLHGGAAEALYYLQAWAATAGAPAPGTDGRSVIPAVEPGAYQACLVLPSERPGLDFGITPPGRCASGILGANGELTLEVSDLKGK
jgi:hypothetical protein